MRNGSLGASPLPKRTSASSWHFFFIGRAGSQSHRDIEHGDRIRLGTNVIVAAGSQLVDGGLGRIDVFDRKRFGQYYAGAILKVELPVLDHHSAHETFMQKIRRAVTISADEFFEMGRYLVLGASLAALLQTFISQTSLLSIGSGPNSFGADHAGIGSFVIHLLHRRFIHRSRLHGNV